LQCGASTCARRTWFAGASFTATGFGIRFPTAGKDFIHNTNEPYDIDKNIPAKYPCS
jgi:hypothetical protein